MGIGRIRLVGGVSLALLTVGCASLLDIDRFADQTEGGSTATGGGATGGIGGATGGTGGATAGAGGLGGSEGGAGGAGAALRVFVTAEVYGGNLQGSDGADQKCADAAAVGAQTHDGVAWQAWLSSAEGEPLQDRFAEGARWVRLDGAVAFENRFRLFDGSGPTHPVSIDQHGADAGSGGGAAVWTGTTAPGQRDQDRCSEWTHGGADHRGAQGDCRSSDAGWTEHESNWCWHQARLYCFEIPPG